MLEGHVIVQIVLPYLIDCLIKLNLFQFFERSQNRERLEIWGRKLLSTRSVTVGKDSENKLPRFLNPFARRYVKQKTTILISEFSHNLLSETGSVSFSDLVSPDSFSSIRSDGINVFNFSFSFHKLVEF